MLSGIVVIKYDDSLQEFQIVGMMFTGGMIKSIYQKQTVNAKKEQVS